MAVADTKKLLGEMLASINDKYARGLIDKHTQVVTIERDSLVEAWKEGYNLFKNKHKDKPFPSGEDWDWKAAVQKIFPEMKAEVQSLGGTIIEETFDYFVFTEKSKTKKIYDAIKNYSIRFIQDNLKDYTLTGAKEEARKAGAPDKDISKFASASDIGTIKRGQERLHRQDTTVGAARLVLSLKWISKTKFFKDFTSSKQLKSLQEKYGEIFATFEASGTKSRGLKLNIKENIRIDIAPSSTNVPGSEDNDWAAIYPKLQKAMLEWAKEAELEGRKGSKSIEKNAADSAEYLAIKSLTSSKNSRTTAKVKESNRKPSSVPVSAKSKKSTKTKKTVSKVNLKSKTKKSKQKIDKSAITLLALLNAKLPATVAKNMTFPRLQYQTGRFAGSVRAVDVSRTNQGFLSVGYTYQKYPYQTFEPGYRMGDSDRDPRKLIDASIREIAAGLIESRLYTRRV